MPIFDQGYQHWQGHLSGHAWRWLAITQQGVRSQWAKNKGLRRITGAALFPAFGLAVILIFWGLLEQKSELIKPVLDLLRSLPEELREGPRAYRASFWTIAFDQFLQVEWWFSMLLVLVVGPGLISQDLRFNAIPLYFSRPLRRIDYFIGKLGVIAVFLGGVTIVPILVAYALGVAFSLDPAVLKDTGRVLGASLLYGLSVVVSAGTLMLALSSLSRNSRAVASMWVAFWIITGTVSNVLREAAQVEWAPLVSYTADFVQVREALLDTGAAYKQFTDLFASAAGQFGSGPMVSVQGPSKYDWRWAAGILAGLVVLSAALLSRRVKSLDRLR
jgi:ABC-2 type transport system permease protein